MIAKLLIGGFVISLLPVWRGYGHTRHHPTNLWHFAHHLIERAEWTEAEGWPHIPYEEAKQRAHDAFVQLYGT